MIAVVFQVVGFVAALVTLFLTYKYHVNPIWFVAAFAFHFLGDILFVEENGVPKMFDIEKYVKLAPFMQFVGTMVMAGAMWFSHSTPVKLVGFLAFGLSMAGFVYDRIYR